MADFIPYENLDEAQRMQVDSPLWTNRLLAAHAGLGLDRLVHDSHAHVREAVADQGFGLDVLICDREEAVRWIAANHIVAESLEDAGRERLAEQYGRWLEFERKGGSPLEWLEENSLSVEGWIEANPGNLAGPARYKETRSSLKEKGFTGKAWVVHRLAGGKDVDGWDLFFAGRDEVYSDPEAACRRAEDMSRDLALLAEVRGSEDYAVFEVQPYFYENGIVQGPDPAIMTVDVDRDGNADIWRADGDLKRAHKETPSEER